MKKQFVLLGLALFSIHLGYSQFTLDGEFRPRTEYRNGYGSIIPDAADASFAVSTRIRLNAGYKTEGYTFYLSLQDVLVWGENRQLKPEDSNNSFSLFEAWADLKLGEGFSTKLDRQAIVYDNQRIMGAVGWAQQARSHDAALLKYGKGKFKADIGLAYNQDFSTTTGNPAGFQSVGTAYNTTGFFSYKTMQYAYLKQSGDTFSGSFLILNNGFQNFETDGTTPDGLSNLLTVGTHLGYEQGEFGVDFNAYLQS
ncbi:hypothetical protein [Maribacter sp.]|uniref:hypothetical protein n=1 Tax=Maribacter sp. TaxID=1897614 RepID=UPI0025C0DA74|nr:hypothetical protein [Maribacter sp.]